MGLAGSFRANALNGSQMSAAQTHEERLDQVARIRVKRDIPPLVYSPYSSVNHREMIPPHRPQDQDALQLILATISEKDAERHLSLTEAYAAHVEGTRRNKGASKLCLHGFAQFPTDLMITPATERMMLAQAVDFVNRHHGGSAVFHARLDRDEAGRHGVDVFYAPKYTKATKRRSDVWVSLTKFGKEMAIKRFGQKPKETKTAEENPETGKPIWKTVLDASGDPIMVDCDSMHYQGQALQDLFFEHLRDSMKLAWVQRGEKKIGRDPDRLEVEEYKLKQEREKIRREFQEALEAAREFEAFKEKADEMARSIALQKREAEAAMKLAQSVEDQANRNREEAERLAAKEKQNAEVAKANALAFEKKHAAAQKAAAEARKEEEQIRETIRALTPQRDELIALTAEIEERRNLLASLKEQAGNIINEAKKTAEYILGRAKAEARDVVKVIVAHYESFKNVPSAEKQLVNNVVGLREAVTETLTELGIADQRPDLGETDEKGDPPPMLQLIFQRAARRTARKNELINVPNKTPGLGG